ncbi:hypothetical protein EVAR_40888_1 [Eumeta japonica]|uniref:Uncharacterized protein n=1 Tax=Eumeta variegata TaxID=151549 RepID=A0A4C1X8D8_EUMVA|nr:hypothetical protein EVAR_40888_1 [Eumeta japonica]
MAGVDATQYIAVLPTAVPRGQLARARHVAERTKSELRLDQDENQGRGAESELKAGWRTELRTRPGSEWKTIPELRMGLGSKPSGRSAAGMAVAAVGINYTGNSPTRKWRTTSARPASIK